MAVSMGVGVAWFVMEGALGFLLVLQKMKKRRELSPEPRLV